MGQVIIMLEHIYINEHRGLYTWILWIIYLDIVDYIYGYCGLHIYGYRGSEMGLLLSIWE